LATTKAAVATTLLASLAKLTTKTLVAPKATTTNVGAWWNRDHIERATS